MAVDSIGNNSFGFNFDAEEAMMANDSQAADNAVAGLASIATTYNKEAQGELYYAMLCVYLSYSIPFCSVFQYPITSLFHPL